MSTLIVTAQDNMILPLETGIWKQENVICTYVSYIENNETKWHKEYSRYYSDVYSTGDTVINDTNYLLIENKNFGIVGAIRQDTNLVYYRPFSESGIGDEVILYDFNVTDIFTIKTIYGKEVSFNVLNIDTINIEGANRKRIEFDDEGGLFIGKYWIEGIGSTGGLLKPFYPTEIPTCEDCCGVQDNLVCLTDNDELLFLKDNYYNCDSIVSSIKMLNESVGIDFGLKESNLLTISTNSGNYIYLVEIYEQKGNMIIKQKVNRTNTFQIRLYNSGLNIVKVYSYKGIETEKIIINNR
jgi:hypothetical protein